MPVTNLPALSDEENKEQSQDALLSVSSENSDLKALNSAVDLCESQAMLDGSGDSAIIAVPIYRQQAAISSDSSFGTASMPTESSGSMQYLGEESLNVLEMSSKLKNISFRTPEKGCRILGTSADQSLPDKRTLILSSFPASEVPIQDPSLALSGVRAGMPPPSPALPCIAADAAQCQPLIVPTNGEERSSNAALSLADSVVPNQPNPAPSQPIPATPKPSRSMSVKLSSMQQQQYVLKKKKKQERRPTPSRKKTPIPLSSVSKGKQLLLAHFLGQPTPEDSSRGSQPTTSCCNSTEAKDASSGAKNKL